MRVIRHPEVPQEWEAAALWCEERQPGLGGDFLEENQATLGRILRERGTLVQNPERQSQAQLPPLPLRHRLHPAARRHLHQSGDAPAPPSLLLA